MALSTGTRSFTRYSYADLMREDRHLQRAASRLAGHAAAAAVGRPGYRRRLRARVPICGSSGAEIMEPLSFKGRRGSGKPGRPLRLCRRLAESAVGLAEVSRTYRVWGAAVRSRCAPGIAGRSRRRSQAPAAFCRSSPPRTCPSAATIIIGRRCIRSSRWWTRRRTIRIPIRPRPRRSATPAPSTRSCFPRINDFAGELLKGERSGKYSPIEVAQWLEDLAQAAAATGANRSAEDAGVPAHGDRCGHPGGAGPLLRGAIPQRRAVCDSTSAPATARRWKKR